MKNSILTFIIFFYSISTFSQSKLDTLIFNHINEYKSSNGNDFDVIYSSFQCID